MGVLQTGLNTKLYNKIMLTEGVLSQYAENRRAEKPLISLAVLQARISGKDYDNLIEWVFAVQFFLDGQAITANQLQLNPITSYLTRVYFDLSLQVNQEINGDGYITMMVACLSLAIKFNQMRSIAEKTTPEALFALFSLPFSSEHYFNIEVKILCALGLRFKYTTPLDFIDIFIARFPFLPNIKHVLPGFIEFASIHPSACEFSSQEIFFGSVLAVLHCKGITLGHFERSILQGLTDTWNRSEIVKGIIVEGISVFVGEN